MTRPFTLLVAFTLISALNWEGRSSEPVDGGADKGNSGDPASLWLMHVRKCQSGVFSIQADFIQERLHRLNPIDKPMKGTVKARRGGRVRLEYSKPVQRLLVSDGMFLWAFDKKDKTAIRSRADGSLLLRLFELFVDTGQGTDFIARHLGGALQPGDGPAAVELVPMSRDPVVSSIVLTLEESCPCLRRVLVIDHSGAVIRVTLDHIRTNVGLVRKLFTFTPPPGAKILRP